MVWFAEMHTFYYKSVKAAPKVQERFLGPIKAMIEENPSFGYQTVAYLLDFNKNTVQRIFKLKGWQVRKRPVGFRPSLESKISKADSPNERWATDLCRAWSGRDGWSALALVIDCYTRELLGWHISWSGKSRTAEITLENTLICRLGSLGAAHEPLLLRSDNGLLSQVAAIPRSSKAMASSRSSSRLHAAAKWVGGADYSNFKRAVYPASPVRNLAARIARCR